MARPTPGMGRGLSAILSVADEQEAGEELRELPLEAIVASPRQPRREFDAEALQALAGSLGEQGVLQPVLVRPLAGGTRATWLRLRGQGLRWPLQKVAYLGKGGGIPEDHVGGADLPRGAHDAEPPRVCGRVCLRADPQGTLP